MPEIHLSEDQGYSDVTSELVELGLTENADFRTHFTWDHKPIVEVTDEAYDKWQKKHGSKRSTAASKDDDGDEADDSKRSGTRAKGR